MNIDDIQEIPFRSSSTVKSHFLRVLRWMRLRRELLLFLYFLVLYLLLILEKLSSFPIYFFCDEAMLGVDAHSLLTQGVDIHGVRWPFFFEELGFYSHSISVYLNMPAILLFGLNEFAIRLTTALISVVGVISVYVALRYLYKMEIAWMAFALFLISPIWFHHSRTGFEYVMAASFFLAFGLCYILAFSRHWLYLLPAAFFGAATFYAHTTGRGWMLIACLLLFFLNLPEHLRYWRRLILGFCLFLMLLTPYIHLQITSPEIAMKRLETLDTYHGITDQTITQQANRILKNYVSGIMPSFWYTWEHTQNSGPMERHVIPRLSLVPAWTLPFACAGLVMIFFRFDLRSRTFLALFLASPVPAALVEFNIHRGITVGVFLIVFALLGLGWGVSACKRWPRIHTAIIGLLILGSTTYALWFRHHVQYVAPYLYKDYGFYGVQMGAPQVFGWITAHHQDYQQVVLSHALFNAGHIFIPFYLQDEVAQKTRIADLNQIYKSQEPLPGETVYIVRSDFFRSLRKLNIPFEKKLIDSIPDPNGQPLFEIVTLAKGPEFAEWFSRYQEQRARLITTGIDRKDGRILVEHQAFDIGSAQSIFDHNPETLARTDRLNPARVVIHLSPAPVQRILVTTSHQQAVVTVVTRSGEGTAETLWGSQSYPKNPGGAFATLEFHQAQPVAAVTVIEVEVNVLDADQYGPIHINEIDWN